MSRDRVRRFRRDAQMTRVILREPGIRRAVTDTTADIEAEARRIIRAEAYDEGDLLASVGSDVRDDGDRWRGVAYATDGASLPIEFGNRDHAPVAPLRRAAEAVAGRVDRTFRRGGRL